MDTHAYELTEGQKDLAGYPPSLGLAVYVAEPVGETLCTFIVAKQSKEQRQVLLYDFFFQKGKDIS